MPKFLHDLLDLLRLRFHLLTQYVYPAWQPVGALLLLGFVCGAGMLGLKAGLIERAAFMIVLNFLQVVLLTFWLMFWWRFVLKRPVQGSLFPLIALVSSAQFLIALATTLMMAVLAPLAPGQFMLIIAALGFACLFLMVAAIASALNERRIIVLLALFAYFPTALSLSQIALGLMLNWGWMEMPPNIAAIPAGK